MSNIYVRIKERREFLGYSQEYLAKLMGYKSRSSINKIEIGENDIPQSKIEEFARALQTTPAYLMGWTNNPDANFTLEENHFREVYTDAENLIIQKYRRLPDTGKQAVENMMDTMLAAQPSQSEKIEKLAPMPEQQAPIAAEKSRKKGELGSDEEAQCRDLESLQIIPEDFPEDEILHVAEPTSTDISKALKMLRKKD